MKKSMFALSFLSNLAIASSALAIQAPHGDPTPIAGLDAPANTIVGALKWIGIVVAVIMVIYVGIKYLTAGAGTKADVKSNLVPMLIGAGLIALASILVESVFGMFQA